MRRALLLMAWLAACSTAPPASAPEAAEPPASAPPATESPPEAPAPARKPVLLEAVRIAEGPLAGARLLAHTTLETTSLEVTGSLGVSFELAGGRTPVLVGGGSLVDPERKEPLLAAGDVGPIAAVARRPGSDLAVIASGTLGFLRKGAFEPLLRLPFEDYEMTGGAEGLYLFRRGEIPAEVLLVREDGWAKLARLPVPVLSATALGKRVFLGVDGAVYSLAPGDEPCIVFEDPAYRFESLAYDLKAGALLASDGKSVIAILDGVAIPVLEGFGGVLRVGRDANGPVLFVLDPERRLLARIRGLDWIGRRAR